MGKPIFTNHGRRVMWALVVLFFLFCVLFALLNIRKPEGGVTPPSMRPASVLVLDDGGGDGSGGGEGGEEGGEGSGEGGDTSAPFSKVPALNRAGTFYF